jgi:hypothetical protein
MRPAAQALLLLLTMLLARTLLPARKPSMVMSPSQGSQYQPCDRLLFFGQRRIKALKCNAERFHALGAFRHPLACALYSFCQILVGRTVVSRLRAFLSGLGPGCKRCADLLL